MAVVGTLRYRDSGLHLAARAGGDGDGAGDGASGSDEEDEALLHQLELAGDDLGVDEISDDDGCDTSA